MVAWISLESAPVRLRMPAREYLEVSYLPALSGNILYVGVGSYTQGYENLTKSPDSFFTLDYDATKAEFGSSSGHYVADFLTFNPGFLFDHISLFGVMGHPPDVKTSLYTIVDDTTILAALRQAHSLLSIGGTLQLGPNHKDFPGQNAAFWMKKFSEPPLDRYKIIFFGVGPDNLFWWGKKIQD